jgi:hypothetical protein
MGLSPFRAPTLTLVLIGALLAGEAHAADHVNMPFDCRSDGDGVQLTPAPERSYAIIGHREREVFTACSPEEPDRCRNWFVHRFDFDCGGARVSWMDAAEAAARYADWDAWVEGTRFRMRMSRDWGVARSRPDFPRRRWRDRFEAREFGEDERFERRSGRYIDLPAGFAPAVGVPLSFSRGDGEVAQADDRPPYAPESDDAGTAEPPMAANERAADRPMEAPPAPKPPEPQAQPQAQPPAVTAAASPPPAAPAIPALPERAPRWSAPSAAPAASAPPAPAEPSATPAPAAPEPVAKAAEPPSTPSTPTIINAPGSAAKVADYEERPQPSLEVKITKPGEPGHTAAAPPGSPEVPPVAAVDPITPPAPVPAEPPRATTEVTEAAKPEPGTETTVVPAGETRSAESMATSSIPPRAWSAPQVSPGLMAAAAATLLVLASLAAFGFWRGARVRVPAPAARDRDYASVSLGAPAPSPSVDPPSGVDNGPSLGPQLGLPPPAAAPVDEPQPPADLPMPKTYEEALAVLGASPDAELQAIKKVVDSLRKTWHPDLARSEFDRIHRERRLQRINVAWDVIARRRSAAA